MKWIEDAKNANAFKATIVIMADPYANTRGYSLLGREFILESPYPVKDIGIFADGTRFEGEFWQVSKLEYYRKVPECKEDMPGNSIFIPQFLAKISILPRDIK